MSSTDAIVVEGAREHNLQGVSVEIPRGSLTVFSGVSGSGKSSLAMDILYAEGQRRYVEALAPRARQAAAGRSKPRCDRIEGLTPTLAVSARRVTNSPRSTVGTFTELADFLRVLFARVGVQHCHQCGREVQSADPALVVRDVARLPEASRFQVIAPQQVEDEAAGVALLEQLRGQGFARLLINGAVRTLDELDSLPVGRAQQIGVVVDRLVAGGAKSRLTDSVETALKAGQGRVWIDVVGGETLTYSSRRSCPDCLLSLPRLRPVLFSFNTPDGMCPECNGLGSIQAVDPERVIPDPSLTFRDGAIVAPGFGAIGRGRGLGANTLEALAQALDFSLDTRACDLDEAQRHALFYGLEEDLEVALEEKRGSGTFSMRWEGLATALLRRYRKTASERAGKAYQALLRHDPCSACEGQRLGPQARAVRVQGRDLGSLGQQPLETILRWCEGLSLEGEAALVAADLLAELSARLQCMLEVGLGYLTLNRAVGTLAGGEVQRLRLAAQLGSRLAGVTYLLDEPTVGLHPRDTERLLGVLKGLRALGNTLVVVEHDAELIRQADTVVDFGPGAGAEGGRILYAGPPSGLSAAGESVTARYLDGSQSVEVPRRRRDTSGPALVVRGPRAFNLRGDDVRFPLGCLVAVTGVSGAGKTSLVDGILYPALARRLGARSVAPGPHAGLLGAESIAKVVRVDQRPLGRSSRSNAATYTGVFSLLRGVFAATPEARTRGFQAGRFSLNTAGGRCDRCRGEGVRRIEMYFLPDVEVPCELCEGLRYDEATLAVRYRGVNMAELLAMPCAQAAQLFQAHPKLARGLSTLCDVGLGYLSLGQAASTLSAGEAQRVKLAKELARAESGHTLYILDEPTTGLHPYDVERLLLVLDRLVDRGNTVVVVEHNMELVKCADWVNDLGPESGQGGGGLVASGSPEQVAAMTGSLTGRYLQRLLASG